MSPIPGSTPQRFSVRPDGNIYRLIDTQTNEPARHETTGAVIDGGGIENNAAADRQAIYLNRWWDKKQSESKSE